MILHLVDKLVSNPGASCPWRGVPFHVLAHLSGMSEQTHNGCEDQLGREGRREDGDHPPADELRPHPEGDEQSPEEGEKTAVLVSMSVES